MSGAFAVHQIGSFRLMKRICAREEKGIERAWRVCVGGKLLHGGKEEEGIVVRGEVTRG